MRNSKIKFILSLIFLFTVGFTNTTEGSDLPLLYLSPSSVQKNTGELINLSVRVDPSEKNVCLVEGRLIFNNLSCESISVAEGLIAQSTPLCSNPYFLIGIPGCSLIDKNIFNMSVRMGGVGEGTISFINVDIVGEGESISDNSVSGNYNIISTIVPSAPSITERPTITEEKEESFLEESVIDDDEVIEIKREPFTFEVEEFFMLSSASLVLAAIGESLILTIIFVFCLAVLFLVVIREIFILIKRKKIKDKKKN